MFSLIETRSHCLDALLSDSHVQKLEMMLKVFNYIIYMPLTTLLLKPPREILPYRKRPLWSLIVFISNDTHQYIAS